MENRVFLIDLQLFSEEKTEAPTPKKRSEARKRAQVPQSQDLSAASVFLLGILCLWALGWRIVGLLREYAQSVWGNWIVPEPDLVSVGWLSVKTLGYATLPLMLAAFAFSGVVMASQVGLLFSTQAISPDFTRIDPVRGFGRIFSRRSAVELVKSLGKVVLVGAVLYLHLKGTVRGLLSLGGSEVEIGAAYVGRQALLAALKAGGALVLLGACDLAYQRWEHERSLMMTRKELKDETKETEGNPQIRSRIREMQRRIARSRMMAEVPKANVCITNPVHFAVALKYVPEKMRAPRVVAKGRDLMARRIRELALSSGVTVVRNEGLAQALYRSTDVGDYVPRELYQAVAEVLAFVYRMKMQAKGAKR
ncbi:MAG: flagellar biosynthesis protein FlhB [Bacillota bacterium]